MNVVLELKGGDCLGKRIDFKAGSNEGATGSDLVNIFPYNEQIRKQKDAEKLF